MKRSVLAVAVATVLALIGCVMIVLYVRGADSRAVAGKEATRVVVAKKRIPKGTTGADIKASDYTEVVTMPKSTVPSDAMESLDQELDVLALTADVAPRQLLLKGMFAAKIVETGGLSIPDGKIALTISVATTLGASYIAPGNKVAIFDTFPVWYGLQGSRDSHPGIDSDTPSGDDLERQYPRNHATRCVLPSVEVIAVGIPGQTGAATNSSDSTSVTGKESDKSTSSTDVTELTPITFAVDQGEAERLILAAQSGRLYLALTNDKSKVERGPGVDYDTLFN